MLNTKLNLYNAEWLDVVFAKRNKDYGAYELRQHYSGTLVKAMAIAFSVVLAASITVNVIARNKPAPDVTTVVDLNPNIIQPPKIEKVKKVEPPVAPAPHKVQPPVKADVFKTMVVTDKPVTEEPAVISELTHAIASKAEQGEAGSTNINVPPADNPGGGGSAATPIVSNEPVSTIGLEVQPEPVGGMDAFSKFLGRNLRFPPIAADAGVQGRVVVSFVIERDGSLSNIVVVKGPGYGMDQEAVRVLKLAKAWKPGIQNGQPVRVRYMIPINFQLPE